ncbi:MAG: arginine deiminase [Rickettsiales bacterium]|nr:MAG: arginine deiminase [Rickettsiales bacterium]
MKQVVNKLQGDWNFVQSFLDNPKTALSGFNLSRNEFDALTTRDTSTLNSLGYNTKAIKGAMSGGHSSTCKP